MSEYSYSADDQSFLTPPLYKFFVDPFVKVLPRWLPANFITIIAFIFVIAAFSISIRGYYNGNYDYWFLIPLLLFGYLIGDCSDGKQARKTNTGSPLGEYFDHFLDSFVTGFLMGILLISFQVTNPFVITIGFFNLYLGQIATFWEHYHHKPMYFAKMSTSEGILAIGLSSWLMSFESLRTGAAYTLFGFTCGDLLIICIMMGSFVTVKHALVTTKTISTRLVFHLIFSLGITVFVAVFYHSDMLYIALLCTCYNVLFLASLLAATAQETEEGLPDLIIPLSCIGLYLLPQYTDTVQALQIIYLAIRIIIRFAAFFKVYKQYWYWINPTQNNHSS